MRLALSTLPAMAILIFALAAVLVSVGVEAAGPAKSNESVSDEENWADDFAPYQGERFDSFDWNLFKLLSAKYAVNTILSPISVKIALVLLYEGAQGQTAHELAGALQLPGGQAATRERFTTILQSLQKTKPGYLLDLGTRLIVDQSIVPTQYYSAIVKTFYNTDVVRANLSDTTTAAKDINAWVSNITHGHVKQRLSGDESLKDSVFLVLNALYFKGTWRHQFMQNATRNLNFFTGISKNVQVPFMHTSGTFFYAESPELDAQILRLPYLGHKFAMFIVLPRARTGLRQLLQDINPYILKRHVWLMETVPVDVSIPKFKFDFAAHLETVLREMGIRDIFDNTASFTRIARAKQNGQRLIVSDIVQQVGLEVTEEGTTAHAVTEVQVGNKISDRTFHATHPFVFYIEDESTGTIVFIGTVTDPSSSGSTASAVPDLPSRFGDSTDTTYPGNSEG